MGKSSSAPEAFRTDRITGNDLQGDTPVTTMNGYSARVFDGEKRGDAMEEKGQYVRISKLRAARPRMTIRSKERLVTYYRSAEGFGVQALKLDLRQLRDEALEDGRSFSPLEHGSYEVVLDEEMANALLADRDFQARVRGSSRDPKVLYLGECFRCRFFKEAPDAL